MKNKVIMRILELCEERRISIYKLAQLSDIPRTTLNNTISEDRMPTIPTIEKVCDGLDITLAQFFSSEKLYPDLTDDQQQILISWEALSPDKKRLLKSYIQMLENLPDDHEE